ncbi:hypothetical protein [Nitrosomonas sp.]|uniref:hypothetical protein n=1 Tax=Nitrosomonas sp. TaxID=42353 RepID=UPI00260BCC14|nr:hypothetical protein [Nitrosomonas sp.]
MMMKKCSVERANVVSPVNVDIDIDIDIDDESVLADGMIPDSRIVKLIDELVTNDDSDDDEDLENTLEFLGVH